LGYDAEAPPAVRELYKLKPDPKASPVSRQVDFAMPEALRRPGARGARSAAADTRPTTCHFAGQPRRGPDLVADGTVGPRVEGRVLA
jgi:hypothetical protein